LSAAAGTPKAAGASFTTMAINANSYGSTSEVAALVPRYADSTGDFNATTNPTLAAVEGMIDRVSGLVNSYLASLGFSVPVTQADAAFMLDNIVVDTVATMVDGVRGSGRYSPKNKAIAERGSWAVISMDVKGYLDDVAKGLENLGVTRGYAHDEELSYITTTQMQREDSYTDD